MDSSLFKIFITVIVVSAVVYVGNNIKEGIDNRNNIYLNILNK